MMGLTTQLALSKSSSATLEIDHTDSGMSFTHGRSPTAEPEIFDTTVSGCHPFVGETIKPTSNFLDDKHCQGLLSLIPHGLMTT